MFVLSVGPKKRKIAGQQQAGKRPEEDGENQPQASEQQSEQEAASSDENEDDLLMDTGNEYDLHSDDSFIANDLDEEFDENVLSALAACTNKSECASISTYCEHTVYIYTVKLFFKDIFSACLIKVIAENERLSATLVAARPLPILAARKF